MISTLVFLLSETPALLHKVVMMLGNRSQVCTCFALVRITGVVIDQIFNSRQCIINPTNATFGCRRINSFWDFRVVLINLNPNLTRIFISFSQ